MAPNDDCILAFLRPQLAEQGHDVTGWNRADCVHAVGTPAAAILHSVLFMPSFVEIGGHVFLDGLGVEARLDPALAETLAAARRESPDRLRRAIASAQTHSVGTVRIRSCSGVSELVCPYLGSRPSAAP